MNKENTSKMKQNITDGLSAATGATAGSILGNTFMGSQAMATENPQGEDADVLHATPAEPTFATTSHAPVEPEQPIAEPTNDISDEGATPEPDVDILAYENVTLDNEQPEHDPVEPEQPIAEAADDILGEVTTPEPDVDILAYESVTLDNGQQMDFAAVQEGEEVSVYVDNDVDGTADIKWTDTNHNDEVEQDELTNIQEQHIDMANFQESADNMPENTENTMPDYVNDADAGTYMA